MALLIKNKVNNNGLSRVGCYIQVQPYLTYGLGLIPCDRGIWADKKEFDKSPIAPTINQLNEIPASFSVDPLKAPKDCTGKTVLLKMLYWINEEIKAQLLVANPTWKPADIEIIEL